MGDQAVKQPGHGCFPTAGSPAEQDKRTVLNSAGNMFQSAFRTCFFTVRANRSLDRKMTHPYIQSLHHPLAASTVIPAAEGTEADQQKKNVLHMKAQLTDICPLHRAAQAPCESCLREFLHQF